MKLKLLYIYSLLPLIILGSPEFTYQNYKPIEDVRLEIFAQQILDEAKVIYGKSAYPIKEVYFFQSKLVDKPYLLSVADFFNWQAFQAGFSDGNYPKKINQYLLDNCPFIIQNEQFSFAQKVKIVRVLNNLIDNRHFFNESDWKNLNLTSEQRSWAGKGFWGLFFKDIIRLNRNLVTTIFAKSIFKYYDSSHYGEYLQSCQSLDLEKGRYAIFLRNLPKDGGKFYTELCHEIFHLLNARLFDWYAEGFATTFSKNLSRQYNFSWESWEEKFAQEVNNPYSLSYNLCSELDKLNNPKVNRVIQFVRLWDEYTNRYCVNQAAWLSTLSPDVRVKVKKL